jgi:hypothetical protein
MYDIHISELCATGSTVDLNCRLYCFSIFPTSPVVLSAISKLIVVKTLNWMLNG